MKGLLLKDFYMTLKYCRSFLLLVIVFLAVSFAGENNLFFAAYPCIFCGMIPVSLLSYDERSKWDVYSGTLPYSKAQLVSVKYLIGLCIEAIVLVLSGAAQAVRMSMAGTFAVGDWLILMSVFLVMALLAPTTSLPFMFQLGVEKGRVAYYVAMGTLCATAFILQDVLGKAQSPQTVFHGVLPILCLAVIALYALSWYLSILFYQKREL